MKLNLGCGKDIREGYLNYDTEIDLTKELPFKDNSVEEVILNHVIEHIENWDRVLIKELYRICKHRAIIKIRTPYFQHESAYSNFQHYRFFTYTTFDLLYEKHPEHFHIPEVNFKTVYKHLNFRTIFKPIEILANLIPRIWQELQLPIFIPKELEVDLKVIK